MADAPLLEVSNVETCYGLSQVLFGMSLAIAPGEMVTLMGQERHGQDHDGALDHGAHPRDDRLDPFRWPGNPRAALLSGGQARHRAGAGRAAGLPQPDRAREPGRDRRQPHATRRSRGRSTRSVRCSRGSPSGTGNMANQLSGGEQQMLAIGRALMTNPRLLILDEATEGLGPAHPRRNLAMPHAAQGRRPVDPGDRQECRGADPHRRPPLPDRARPGGVERNLRAARRRAGRAASLLGRLIALFVRLKAASGPIPKFASLCGTLVCELRNPRTTGDSMILMPPFEPEVRDRICCTMCANFGFGALERCRENQRNRNQLVTGMVSNSWAAYWGFYMGKHRERLSHRGRLRRRRTVMEVEATPKMALASLDPPKIEMPKIEVPKIATPAIEIPKTEVGDHRAAQDRARQHRGSAHRAGHR